MNEAKVNVKQPESNIEAKPEFPAEPIVAETAPQSKAAETQLKSPFSHPVSIPNILKFPLEHGK